MNSRDKGKRGELELSNLLKKHGFDTRRGQQYCGANGDADVVGIPGIHIECKRVEKLNLEKAFEQACYDAKNGEVPTVWHRKNRMPWLVTLAAEDFIKLLKERDETHEEKKNACVCTLHT